MTKSVVYKHEIHVDYGYYVVRMPVNAEILAVDEQDHKLVLWEKHDFAQKILVVRQFYLGFTGHVFEEPKDQMFFHVGTVQRKNGTVVHVFEIIELESTR